MYSREALQELVTLRRSLLRAAYEVPLHVWDLLESTTARYDDRGIILEFSDWMRKRSGLMPDLEQDLAVYEVMRPLLETDKRGLLGITLEDLIERRADGTYDSSRFMRVLKATVDSMKAIVEIRGSDYERAWRLASEAGSHQGLIIEEAGLSTRPDGNEHPWNRLKAEFYSFMSPDSTDWGSSRPNMSYPTWMRG
jgi:hypothetical protein